MRLYKIIYKTTFQITVNDYVKKIKTLNNSFVSQIPKGYIKDKIVLYVYNNKM